MFEGVTEEMLIKARAENDALMAAEKLLRDNGYTIAFIHDGKDELLRRLKEYSELAGKDQVAIIDTDALNGALAKIGDLCARVEWLESLFDFSDPEIVLHSAPNDPVTKNAVVVLRSHYEQKK